MRTRKPRLGLFLTLLAGLTAAPAKAQETYQANPTCVETCSGLPSEHSRASALYHHAAQNPTDITDFYNRLKDANLVILSGGYFSEQGKELLSYLKQNGASVAHKQDATAPKQVMMMDIDAIPKDLLGKATVIMFDDPLIREAYEGCKQDRRIQQSAYMDEGDEIARKRMQYLDSILNQECPSGFLMKMDGKPYKIH